MLIEHRSAGSDRAFLSDFGAGRSLEATATGNWLGTVDYVAPETIRGAPPDARSDRYGLACVLFEALTGSPPFHRDTAWATMWAHYSDPIPSACERRPALPRAVDAVLARGLAKDPDERYATSERLIAGARRTRSFPPGARRQLRSIGSPPPRRAAGAAAGGEPAPAVPAAPPVRGGRSGASEACSRLGGAVLAVCVIAAVVIISRRRAPHAEGHPARGGAGDDHAYAARSRERADSRRGREATTPRTCSTSSARTSTSFRPAANLTGSRCRASRGASRSTRAHKLLWVGLADNNCSRSRSAAIGCSRRSGCRSTPTSSRFFATRSSSSRETQGGSSGLMRLACASSAPR